MGKPHTDLDVFRNITAFCQRETDETKLPKLIDDAIKAALITKHPVYLEAPKDLFSRPCSPPAAPIDTTVAAGAADAVATAILQDLATATNPVVVVGEEVQRYGLAAKVLTVSTACRSAGKRRLSANRYCPNSIRVSSGCSTATRHPQP